MGSFQWRNILDCAGMLICLVCLVKPVFTSTCKKVSSCKCEYGDGGIVDLSPLANSDGTAKYQDVSDGSVQDIFSWNPCTDFTEGGCAGVAACQIRQELPATVYYTLGSQASASFVETDDGKLTLQYSGDQASATRTSVVVLTCANGDDTFIALGERGASAFYDFELKSPHACAKGGISAGSILLIIFFSCVALYFIIGIPVQIFVRKESGKRVIPFSDFWFGFPALVKEGSMFVVRRGKPSGYERK